MPRGTPPTDLAPVRHLTVPAGQLLWRIARHEQIRDASIFSSKQALAGWPTCAEDLEKLGGRFDATEEAEFSYCYLALDDLTAVAETVLRDVAFTDQVRTVPRKQVRGRCLAVFEALKPLQLVALTTAAELARARQDTWLIHAGPTEYWRTRRWGHWLRQCSKDAHGLIWPSRRNPGGHAIMLFGDRCGTEAVATHPVFTRDLDGTGGETWLNNRLQELNTCVEGEPEEPDGPG